MEEIMAEMKHMFMLSKGVSDLDIYDFMPYHDVPFTSFEEEYQRYHQDDEV